LYLCSYCSDTFCGLAKLKANLQELFSLKQGTKKCR
jgi:hypothetical protein